MQTGDFCYCILQYSLVTPPPSHTLIPTVHSGQTVLAGDATPGSSWSPRASCGPPAGQSGSCHLSVSHPPPCLLPTVLTLRWPHEPQHQDLHWVSGYCHVTVMWLSCDCHATVMLLSCYCHTTVMLLSYYCHAAVTVMWLSCDCHATVMWVCMVWRAWVSCGSNEFVCLSLPPSPSLPPSLLPSQEHHFTWRTNDDSSDPSRDWLSPPGQSENWNHSPSVHCHWTISCEHRLSEACTG